MKTSPNRKKVRAVLFAISLVAVTNFAISHAESILPAKQLKVKTLTSFYATDAGNLPPGPRPSSSFATDAGNLPPGPRPSSSFATDAGNLPPGPRPSSSYATDAGNLPPGPRPVM